jgi:hypothetical protein
MFLKYLLFFTNEKEKNVRSAVKEKDSSGSDHSGTDRDADHTLESEDSDKTTPDENPRRHKRKGRYNKPKREVDPDGTGIDTDADKTKGD